MSLSFAWIRSIRINFFYFCFIKAVPGLPFKMVYSDHQKTKYNRIYMDLYEETMMSLLFF